jgi:integrase
MTHSVTSKYRGNAIRPRGQSWQVDFGTREGRRVQRSFTTKADAKIAIDQYVGQQTLERIDLKNKRVALFDLTDAQRMDVISAYEKLNGIGSLTQAVEFYLLHTSPPGGSRTVREVLAEYLESKTRANRRKNTILDVKTRVGRFSQDHGDSPIHELTTTDLENWLNKYDYRQISRLNYRTALVGFFNFAVKRGYTQSNPAEGVERPILDETTPEILTVKECRDLLAAAEEFEPRMVPYFAICLFAGLRPTEAAGLDWRYINLVTKTITVRPEVAKKRRQRLVDISDNLLAWLTPHGRDSGGVVFSRKGFEKARREAGVTWANDILRHSYGSYHLAKHQDAAKTALQMGHIRTDILYNHYRELVNREDANAYWSIKPSGKARVLRLTA